MGTDALQVRRNGDFYYPIYFEDGFEKLADEFGQRDWRTEIFVL